MVLAVLLSVPVIRAAGISLRPLLLLNLMLFHIIYLSLKKPVRRLVPHFQFHSVVCLQQALTGYNLNLILIRIKIR